jgi:hypothetical protein
VLTTTIVLHGEPAVTDVVAALDASGFPGSVLTSGCEDPHDQLDPSGS